MNRPYLLNIAIATLCAFCYVTGCKSNAHFDQVVKIQNPNSTKTISSSISNKDINVIAQDSEGFVWIGTFRGLNRFDSETIINISVVLMKATFITIRYMTSKLWRMAICSL